MVRLWDRSTDGPLRGKARFVYGSDRPMVFYEVTRVIYLWHRSTDGTLQFVCGVVQPTTLFYRQALPALFDGPEDYALPMARWDIQYTSPPALSDGEGEARRFAKTVVPMGRRGSVTVT